jgi:hypothetical protein
MPAVKYKPGVRVQTKTKNPKFGTVVKSVKKGFYSVLWDNSAEAVEVSVHSMKVVPEGAGQPRAGGKRGLEGTESDDEPDHDDESSDDEEDEDEDEEEDQA